jgi:hypothetical protein
MLRRGGAVTAHQHLVDLIVSTGCNPHQSRRAAENLLAAHRQEATRPLVEQLALATEFRIPCPQAADPGRPMDGPVLQPEPLIVQKVAAHWADRFPDGWRILNPNLEPGDHVWTGDGWVYCGQLHIGVIYRWTRDEAITEAQRLAVEETRRYETWLADMRAKARQQ